MIATPDGPKWTARSGSNWRWRGEGGGSGRELRDEDVPSRCVSPFTLLSYKGGYHGKLRHSRRP